MEGTRCETYAYYKKKKISRMKVIIIAGIHGNEVAGIKAAESILENDYSSSLIVIPRANIEASKLKVRTPYYMEDLNRSFPGNSKGSEVKKLANEIFTLIEKEKPDFVLDLHEWNVEYDEDPKLHSNGLILDTIEGKFWKTVEKVYNDIKDENIKTMLTLGPPKGSLNKEVTERLKIPVLTIETNMNQPLEDRINFHISIIERLIKYY